MAEVQVTSSGVIASEDTSNATAHIPIAQLTPLLAAPASRSIQAVVTLTWPYSSISGSVAFLLAEPDFRLRRIRGQVRVQFAGSSAKAISKSGIASGDQVLLCLDGVEFVQNQETTISTPGRGVEFELKFTERLVVEFHPEGSDETKKIDIDHPAAEPEIVPARLPTPETSLSPRPAVQTPQDNAEPPIPERGEWASPAFIKRARTSYGSLFDSDYDPFSEQDGTVRGKGRKRTRLSSSWRYNSRSPTPESEDHWMEPLDVQEPTPTKQAPIMTDEASQTIGLEEESAAEVLADFSRQAMNVGGNSYDIIGDIPREQTQGSYDVDTTIHQILPSTVPAANTSDLHLEITDIAERPQSPHLLPISSASLPIVSPILPIKTKFPGEVAPQMHFTSQHLGKGSMEETVLSGGEVEHLDDLYNASPVHRREERPLQDLSALSNDKSDESLPFAESYLPEDQYGHWQSINAQLSGTNTPFIGEERLPDVQYYAEQHQDMQYQDELEYPVDAQYPALEDALQNSEPPDWSFRPAEVSYPEISHPFVSKGVSAPLPSQSLAMSRSQSAISEHVDLTEDDEDDEDELPQPQLGSPFDEDVEESEEEYDEEEENLLENGYDADDRENRLLYESESGDDEEGSDLGHSYDEEEIEEEYDEDAETEEESVKEKQDERSHVKRSPEVIEILSSDDEDEVMPPQRASLDPRHDGPLPHAQRENNEGEDEDEDEEIDEDVDSDVDDRILARSESEHDDQESLIEAGESEDSQEASDGEESEIENDKSPGPELEKHHSEMTVIVKNGGPETGSKSLDDELQITQEEDLETSGAPLLSTSHLPLITETRKDNSHRSLSQGQFSMDGSGDDLAVASPVLPEGDMSVSEVQSTVTGMSETRIETVAQGDATQLPTPANTQLTEKIFSEEQSFTSVESEHPIAQNSTQKFIEASDTVLDWKTSVVDVDVANADEGSIPKLPIAVNSSENMRDESSGFHSISVPEITEERFEPITDGMAEEPDEKFEEVRSSSQPRSVIESTRDETLEEEFEAIVEQAIREASEIPHSGPPQSARLASPAPETLEEEFEAIVEQAEQQASEEAKNSSLPTAVPETLEKEFEVDSERANKEPMFANAEEREDHSEFAGDFHEIAGSRHTVTLEESVAQTSSPAEKSFISTEPVTDSPRRSSRRSKPSPNTLNPKENVRPVTPVRSIPLPTQDEVSSLVALDSRGTPRGHDASLELALAPSDSPVKHDLRKPPLTDVKLRLSRALRTELSEFTPLKVLRYHMNQKMDVLGIATTSPPEPQRAKGGPRHYSIVFNITDPSIAPSGVAEVQVFRPYKDALPTIEVGDGILLRNFQVVSVKKGFALRSMQDEGSSWAVFKSSKDPEIRGPPVEYGEGEKNHVAALKEWYESLDTMSMAKINRANGDKGTPGSVGKSIGKG